jgi:DNA polymerase-3 subunit alpha
MIAYQTAYLKANEPAAFMAALLTADEGDVDRMAVLVDEARAMSIEVAPPDINASMEHFTVVDNNGSSMIRFGLVGVKNVGAGVAAEIIGERSAHGPFAGIENLLERLPKVAMNKKPLESLIQCGALDAFGDRGVLLANVEKMLAFARRGTTGPAPQASLFGVLPAPRLKMEDAAVAGKADKLRWEKHLLGLYITEHPWEDWRKIIGERALPISNLAEQTPQSYVTIGGVIALIHRIVTKAGAPMAFVTIEDTTGTTEVLVFPKTLEATRDSWVEERAVLVRGKFSDKDGEAKVLCDKVIVLDDAARERFTKENAESDGAVSSEFPAVYLRLPKTHTRELLNEVRKTLEQMPGTHRVIFIMPDGQQVATPMTIAWDDATESAITALLGADAARQGG